MQAQKMSPIWYWVSPIWSDLLRFGQIWSDLVIRVTAFCFALYPRFASVVRTISSHITSSPVRKLPTPSICCGWRRFVQNTAISVLL